MEWFDAKKNPPPEEGSYVCVIFNNPYVYRRIVILNYSFNLESVNKYQFEDKKRSGWYDYDDEYGYYETAFVTHWMPLPELPGEEGKNE